MAVRGNKAYKFRIYPTAEQRELFAKTFGCVRFVYNRMLSDKNDHYHRTGKMLDITPARYKEEFPWLKEVDSLALANAQLNLQRAYKSYYEVPGTGSPGYKTKRAARQSYTTNCVNGNIRLTKGSLRLPKVGCVKIRQHREIPEEYKLKSVTISRNASGTYYASILYEYEVPEHRIVPQTFLGLDYAMRGLYVDSSKAAAEYPGFYRKAEARLKKEQRRLSLMKKGSKNREKQRRKVAKLHEKTANQRKDFLHKQSRQITNAYDCICIEDLNMKGMSQSLHFGKSVLDNGWGMFTGFLEYKLKEEGKQLVKVDKHFASSQLCSCCGYQNPATKDLSVRRWICPSCGSEHDRDVNAAINIRNEGMRIVLHALNIEPWGTRG